MFNFTQDDLLSEDIMILDGQNAIHVWVGQHTSSNDKVQAWDIAQVSLFPLHQRRGCYLNLRLCGNLLVIPQKCVVSFSK